MMSVKNKQQTMKNVHLIPTDKPSRLFRSFGKLNIGDYTTERENTQIQNQNIYITSDEEIKEGDWFLNKISMKIYKNIWDDYSNNIYEEKIILTTDVDLIKDGVQAIDDEFLEWFVKNLSCESVETEIVEYGFDEVPICIYKIIIPKEEPKQEALEEAALKWFMTANKREIIFDLGWIKIFEAGAKWQQERMYSEEDMEDYSNYCWKLSNDNRYKTPLSPKEWFEQFKKK